MAFASVDVKLDGASGFRGIYDKVFIVTGVKNFPSTAAGSTSSDTITIPGLALGDHVISWGADINANANLTWSFNVTAVDTLTVRITNTHGSNPVDLASATLTFVIGRPFLRVV